MNYLYYGDNLDILRKYIQDESVDLIYLDPPFKSDQSYNVLFLERNGTKSGAQIKAFQDTWHWDLTAEKTWTYIVEKSSNRKLSDLMIAMRKFLGTNDMMAYLVMMTIRLEELHRVLKSTGSIYLHCDPTASHYLKLVMDATFGHKNFLNEIVWCYKERERVLRKWNPKHDVILFYCKDHHSSHIFSWKEVAESYSEVTLAKFKYKDERGHYQIRGRNIKGSPIRAADGLRPEHEKKYPGFTYRDYLEDRPGVPPRDWWRIGIINKAAKERLGYPTQKPEAVLERIVKASSNEGDVILDPFCGCGTTLIIAEKLKRKWMGIDITHLAVALMEYRLRDTFGDSVEYKVRGVPVSIKDAEDLAQRDRLQFQSWALSLVKAKPEPSDVADRGIDGRIYFHDHPEKKEIKEIIVQVKSGGVNPGMVRDLKGVVEREKAQIGVLISLQRPTRGMKEEAASSGFYKSPIGKQYPKIQILTIDALFNGKGIQRPPEGISSMDKTFKKAKRFKVKQGEQEEMF